jgi:hypothetical protein
LYWSTTGTKNAPNYIWTYLYDVNGNLLSGYPVEDPTDYVIPATQTSTTCTTATGAEPDNASGAASVVLNVTGEWNPNSTGSEACGALDREKRLYYVETDYARFGLAASFTRTRLQERPAIWTRQRGQLEDHKEWDLVPGARPCPCGRPAESGLNFPVWTGMKRNVPGASKKCDIWVYLSNPSGYAAKWYVGYALLKKTDAGKGHIIPVKRVDSHGKLRMFHCLEHDGSPQFIVAGHTSSKDVVVVNDLRIDLGAGGIDPADYVYLDVFAMDPINHRNAALPRIQLQP